MALFAALPAFAQVAGHGVGTENANAAPELRGDLAGRRAQRPGLVEFVCTRYRGFPVAEALRYGPEDLPALRAILDDPEMRHCWPGVVLTSGIIGEPQVFEHLTHFIESVAPEPAAPDAFVAMRLAFEGLGFLVRRDRDPVTTRRALRYLIESTAASSWEERGLDWRLPEDDRRYVVKVLTSTAVIGLAFTAHQEARVHLDELLTREPAAIEGLGPDSYAFVEASLDALERRMGQPIEAEPGPGCDR